MSGRIFLHIKFAVYITSGFFQMTAAVSNPFREESRQFAGIYFFDAGADGELIIATSFYFIID